MKYTSYWDMILHRNPPTFPPQFVANASSNPLLVVVVGVVLNGSPENGSNEVLVGVGKLLMLVVCMK